MQSGSKVNNSLNSSQQDSPHPIDASNDEFLGISRKRKRSDQGLFSPKASYVPTSESGKKLQMEFQSPKNISTVVNNGNGKQSEDDGKICY